MPDEFFTLQFAARGHRPTPTIFREKGYRFYFYEADLDEPIHVHVAKSSKHAKIWVEPIRVAVEGGFKRHELSEIERITRARRSEIYAA